MTSKPNEIIAELIELWCDRRELRPLAIILPTYIGNNGLTDGWADLHDDLRHAYAMCIDLPDTERDRIRQAQRAIDMALRNR